MDNNEQKLLDAIDVDGLVAFLSEMIAIRSLGGEETAAQERVAAHMKSLGLDVDVWDIDFNELAKHPSYSAEIDRGTGLGVAGALGDGGGATLVLNGHVDVVPAGDPDRWSVPPWEATIKAGRVYGRGSADMKGGLCCALFAAKAFRDSGVELPGRLLIQSVVGEEDGGCGTLAAVVRGHTGDGGIVLEPTELMVAPAQAGALNFRIRVPGRAAHGCFRDEGVSPIEKFFPVYDALMALERSRNESAGHPLFADYPNPYALCVGTVRSGVWASTVGEELVFEGRYGVAVGEDIPAARRRFEEVVADAAATDPWLRDNPPELDWWGAQFSPAETPVDHAVVTTLTRAFRDVTASEPVLRGMPYGADMRLLVNDGGTPTVLFGPGNVRHAHAPDEFVTIDDLATAARSIALTAYRFCRA